MGPDATLDRLYRDHGGVVFRRARKLLGNDEDAAEMLHEVFLALARDPGQFRGESVVTTWLYRIATNHCLNRLRDMRTRARVIAQSVAPATDHTIGARAENLALARDLVARLPEDLAAVAIYHYVDEMTQAEVAEVLGCSRRHIVNLLARLDAWLAKSAARENVS